MLRVTGNARRRDDGGRDSIPTDDLPDFGESDETIAVVDGKFPAAETPGFDQDEATTFEDPDVRRSTLVPDRPTDPAPAGRPTSQGGVAELRASSVRVEPALGKVSQRFGPYILGPPIGAGGMAEVRLGQQPLSDGTNRPVVIKRIAGNLAAKTSYREMFDEEAKLSRLLAHPNVVKCYDAGVFDGTPYIVFELIDGVTVNDLRKQARRTLPHRAVVEIGLAVARALSYAHDLKGPGGEPLKLVHRDISPQNILISRAGEVKLVDFGIARFEGRMHATMAGEVKGKMRYMPPEQLAQAPLTGRADIFALGIVLGEQLDLLEEGLTEHFCTGLLPNPRTLPPGLYELLSEMAAPKEEDRPGSALEVASTLEAIARTIRDRATLKDFAFEHVFSKRAPLGGAAPLPAPTAPAATSVRMGGKSLGVARTDFDDDAEEDEPIGYADTVMRYANLVAAGSEPPPPRQPEILPSPTPPGARPRAATPSPAARRSPSGATGPAEVHRPAQAPLPSPAAPPQELTPSRGRAEPFAASPHQGQTPPGYQAPQQTPPGYSMPGQTPPGYSMPGQTPPGYPVPGQTHPGYPVPGQTHPGYPVPGQTHPGYPVPGQTHPGYPVPGQASAGQQQPWGTPQFPYPYDPSAIPNGYQQATPPSQVRGLWIAIAVLAALILGIAGILVVLSER